MTIQESARIKLKRGGIQRVDPHSDNPTNPLEMTTLGLLTIEPQKFKNRKVEVSETLKSQNYLCQNLIRIFQDLLPTK